MKKATLWGLVFLLSCSSANKMEEEKHEKRKREYQVIDYSHQTRPGWIRDANAWAKKYNHDTSKMRYFAFETEPKSAREVACHLAQANARAQVAAEITTHINKTLSAGISGDAHVDQNNPRLAPLRHYVEQRLEEQVKASVRGARPVQTYWEKRKYLQDRGAKEDFVAYSCASLIGIATGDLKRAIADASKEMVKQVPDKKSKEDVKKILQQAQENIVKEEK